MYIYNINGIYTFLNFHFQSSKMTRHDSRDKKKRRENCIQNFFLIILVSYKKCLVDYGLNIVRR